MIRRLFLFFNVCILVMLLMASLACYISPLLAWPLSFAGIGFPIIAIVSFIFMLVSAAIREKIFWLDLFAMLLCIPFIRTVYGFHFSAQQENGIKVMSYNVRNFDLYNWSGNKKTRARLMGLIKSEDPGIICFQEYYTDDEEFCNTEYLRDSLGYKYHYLHVTYDKWYKNSTEMKWHHLIWGLAIFSRYEISDTGTVPFQGQEGNQCIYADLKVDSKSLRVYNTHLQSMHLGYGDYDALEEMSENQSASWRKMRNIAMKMKRAYIKRASQAEAVHDHVSRFKGQKIVCGDFNDTPVSYAYQTVSSGLNDAFIERAKGFGQTYDTRIGLFRIDFVLPDPSIKVNSYRCIPRALSDHFPVVVTLDL